jgi:hypothetical protein
MYGHKEKLILEEKNPPINNDSFQNKEILNFW